MPDAIAQVFWEHYNHFAAASLIISRSMLVYVHEEMTREALAGRFSPRALEIIIAANLKQDSWRGQIGHDEYHFDNNAFEKSYRYIDEQRGYVLASLLSPGMHSAWIAFGRLIHTAQDFYSHTNYIPLWLDEHNGSLPSPPEIDPLRKDLIQHPKLHSGRLYLPMDALYFIPFLRRAALAFLPADSHGRMNLDSPAQGPRFKYARAAAIKRTVYEFELLERLLTPEMFARFIDL
jgi:hypothetical protein